MRPLWKKPLAASVTLYAAQLLVALLLPAWLISKLGADGYVQATFLFLLINPASWTGQAHLVNSRLLARMGRSGDFSRRLALFATGHRIYWIFLTIILAGAGVIWEMNWSKPWILIALAPLPFLIERAFRRVYQAQKEGNIALSQWIPAAWLILWVLFLALMSQWIATLEAMLVATWLVVLAGAFLAPSLPALKRIRVKHQASFILLAFAGILVPQIDKLIIQSHLSWEEAAYFWVPLGLLMKFPALLEIIQKAFLSRIASNQATHVPLIRRSLLLIGVAVPATSFWLSAFLSLLISADFASQAGKVTQLLLALFGPALLLGMAQTLYYARQGSKANGLFMLVGLFHLLGTWYGATVGLEWVSLGFASEALAGQGLLIYLLRKEKDRISYLSWGAFWGASLAPLFLPSLTGTLAIIAFAAHSFLVFFTLFILIKSNEDSTLATLWN